MALANDSLDTLIVKATNPLVDHPDPLDLATFCEKVTHEVDGPQIAVKLLAYRIHSPQEKEALNALALLEQCVKSCGQEFHSEIGKFRFLNELIKLVSPKYQAHRTPNRVKQRILEILYTWTIDLKSELKIQEAYEMLRKQGVIKENPNYLGTGSAPKTTSPVAPREKSSLFDNSEKDALLQRLLKSKNPEDLQAANRLIKSMVREEENRVEAASRRQLEIATVNSNIRLLEELLDNVETNGASAEELELCKELATSCDKFRPNLSKLATETDEKEEGLGEILRTSDELSQVLERYEALMKSARPPPASSQPQGAALDLLGLDTVVQHQPSPRSSLDDQLLYLGLDDLTPTSPSVNLLQPHKVETNVNGSSLPRTPDVKAPAEEMQGKGRGLDDLDLLGEALMKQSLPANVKPVSSFQKLPDRVPLNMMAKKKALDELGSANQSQPAEVNSPLTPYAHNPANFDLLAQSTSLSVKANPVAVNPTSPISHTVSDLLVPITDQANKVISVSVDHQPGLNADTDVLMLGAVGNSISDYGAHGVSDDVQLLRSPPITPNSTTSCPTTAPALADISLKFEDIKPSTKPPILLIDQESGVKVSLHSATANVPKNVSVFVVSVTSCSSSPLANFTFQAIVPKGSRVKLQPPSDNKLPAFNPFLPPPAITQIVLLSTAGLNLIELKFVISFDMDGETVTEMGSVKELVLHLDAH